MDMDTYIRFVLALIFVLSLIGLAAWLIRRFGVTGRFMAKTKQQTRLGIVEMAVVDAKRRLVLVRRDHQEHLLLLGANSELVVEQGIKDGLVASPAGKGEAIEKP